MMIASRAGRSSYMCSGSAIRVSFEGGGARGGGRRPRGGRGGVSDGGVEQLVAAATVGLIEEGAGVEIVGGEGDAGTREVEAVPDVGVDLVDLLDPAPTGQPVPEGQVDPLGELAPDLGLLPVADPAVAAGTRERLAGIVEGGDDGDPRGGDQGGIFCARSRPSTDRRCSHASTIVVRGGSLRETMMVEMVAGPSPCAASRWIPIGRGPSASGVQGS